MTIPLLLYLVAFHAAHILCSTVKQYLTKDCKLSISNALDVASSSNWSYLQVKNPAASKAKVLDKIGSM
jgi:hypothetical protein